MQKRKKEKGRMKEHPETCEYIICEMCGGKIEPDASVWQEDDDGAVYCNECTLENESCGCSD